MSKLIPNNEILVRFVPNVLKSVQGELALFEKIQSHLEVAEDWLCANFFSAPVLDKIAVSGYDATNKLLHHARIAEVAEAMLHAIPQLDLVLTPNGFGIVSNSNVAPASKERVERLLASLEKMRDDTLQVLLPMLTAEATWADTAPCQYFQSVLYPWLDLPRKLGSTDHVWQRFQELHSQMVEIEQRLAADFFSHSLMDALRQAHLFGTWSGTPSAPHYKSAWQHIFAIELFMLRENECPVPSCIEVVNALRNAPEGVFVEWKQSKTALLFENHGYKNERKSGGYWF